MKLTILGKYGPWPAADGACSGYLLEAGGRRLLLDCGSGVLSRLQSRCAIADLDAVVLSHLHSDHMGDMLVLRYALPFLTGRGLLGGKLKVFMPPAPEGAADTLAEDTGFDARFVGGESSLDFLGLRLSFFPVHHPFPCHAVRVEAEGKAFVYSGDLNTTPGFERFASGADLLLIDGCFPEAEWNERLPHLSAALAAGYGARAGAGRVVLTHMRPFTDEEALLREAAAAFPGAEMAREGAEYTF